MPSSKPLVLYIDDDPDYRDTIRVVLEANGYEMADASSAEEGLVVFRRTDPDFVIVDLMMEEVDAGTNLVRELRAKGNTVPIYILSSVGDMLRLNIDCDSLGVEGVLQKPLDANTLLTVLRNRLSGRAEPAAGSGMM